MNRRASPSGVSDQEWAFVALYWKRLRLKPVPSLADTNVGLYNTGVGAAEPVLVWIERRLACGLSF